jgi:hypothetical protein
MVDEVGQTVPGWRSAKVLSDPTGVMAQLKIETEEWRWEDLGDAPDCWVAEQLVGSSRH